MFQEKAAEEAPKEPAVGEKIPAGDDHSPRTCTVCREPIELYWDDDSDEWMLKNATIAGDEV